MPFQPAIDEPSKAWPDAELVFVEVRDGHGDVLLLAAGVGEAEVDELDFVFLHHLHHVGNGLCHQGSPSGFAMGGIRWDGGVDGPRGGPRKAHGNVAESMPSDGPPGAWPAGGSRRAAAAARRAPSRCNPSHHLVQNWQLTHQFGAECARAAQSSPSRSATKASSLRSARPLTPSSMCRPWTCGWSTLGRLKTRMPVKRRSTSSISGVSVASIAAEHDHRTLALRAMPCSDGIAAVEHPLDHRPGHHREAGHEVHVADRETRGSCCTGWG